MAMRGLLEKMVDGLALNHVQPPYYVLTGGCKPQEVLWSEPEDPNDYTPSKRDMSIPHPDDTDWSKP